MTPLPSGKFFFSLNESLQNGNVFPVFQFSGMGDDHFIGYTRAETVLVSMLVQLANNLANDFRSLAAEINVFLSFSLLPCDDSFAGKIATQSAVTILS